MNWLLEKRKRGTNCAHDFDAFIGMLDMERKKTLKLDHVQSSVTAAMESSVTRYINFTDIDPEHDEDSQPPIVDDKFDDCPLTTD